MTSPSTSPAHHAAGRVLRNVVEAVLAEESVSTSSAWASTTATISPSPHEVVLGAIAARTSGSGSGRR
ncbi:MAG: hypothetical protein R2749_31150 [Acidimicrobiales bacterium]